MSAKSESVRLKVHPDHIKVLPDPNGLGRKRYFAQVPVDEIYRANITFGPNPRKQNMETKVAAAIRESLRVNGGWFMYFNKGIVINAKNAEYDNRRQTLVLELDRNDGDPWDSPHGNLDGGHTNRAILEALEADWRNTDDPATRQFVTLEVLVGIDAERLSGLVGARNTSAPVKDLALAVLGDELDWLIHTLEKAGVKDKIAWQQFDKAEMAGEELIAYLSLLNPVVKEKTRCYSGSGRIVSDLKRGADQRENPNMAGLRTTEPIAVDFMRLVDYVHQQMRKWYEAYKAELGEKASFGNLSGISTQLETNLIFLDEKIDFRAVKAWLMPLAYSFTGIIAEEKDPKVWERVADDVGPQLMEALVNRSNKQQNNLNAVGKDKTTWDTLRALVGETYWRKVAASRKQI